MTTNNSTHKAQGIQRLLFAALCLFCFLAANAQEKVITNTRYVGIGYNSTQDTYLSPMHYGGMELRFMSHITRERLDTLSKPSRWSRLIINEGVLSKGKSKSENGSMLNGYYHFEYGALHSWLLNDKLTIKAGGQIEFLGGFIYNTRNGNNPAQMRLLMDIGPIVTASYPLGKIRLDYEASMPLAGLCFSPNYGQSYYEIFSEGNYDHNCVPTTIVSTPSLRQMLTANFRLGRFNLSIGYLGDYRQQSVNSLKQHVYSHNLVIGLVKELRINK